MSGRVNWPSVVTIFGFVAMLVGAINPLGGALAILSGSGLVALGAFLGRGERYLVAYRVGVFVLIAIGVGATWAVTSGGGIGGNSGRPGWWGLVALPILIGWSMGIWGPGSPRWVLMPGIVVSVWYLGLLVLVTVLSHSGRQGAMSALPGIVLGAVGLLTITGCIWRLRRRIVANGKTAGE